MSMSSGITLDGRLHLPASALTFQGFRRWAKSGAYPKRGRVSFIAGEVFVDMSPEASESHSRVWLEIAAVLKQIARDEDLGVVYASRMLLSNTAAGLTCEPDVFFTSWEGLERGRIKRVPRAKRPREAVEFEGTPDLVVEVVSDSSTRKDQKVLLEAYAKAGVPEYWLIDARKTKIRFEIFHLQNDRYRSATPLDEPQRSKVLGRRFTLTRSPDRLDGFDYRLASLP
jgi:Uma2 family endonuclease